MIIMISILYLLLGIITGIFTGLFPGIHPNNIAVLSIFLINYIGTENYFPFLIGLVVSHYFISFIPSAFLGVPDDNTAVSILPMHRLTLLGKGYEGVILAGFGSYLGVVFSLLISLIILCLGVNIDEIYKFIKPEMSIILILFVIYQIFTSKHIWEIFVIFLSGIFGIVVLYLNYSTNSILTAIFTGMFGIPILINNLRTNKLVKQEISYPKLEYSFFKVSFLATITGFFRIFLPAVSGAQLNFILSKIIKESNLKIFLVSQGAMILSNEVFSLLSLIFIGKGRSGVAETIRNLNLKYSFGDMFILVLISSTISFIILSYLSKYILKILEEVNFRYLSLFLIILCSLIVIIVCKEYLLYSLVVYIVSISIGLLANLSESNLSNMMNVLVFPTILFFIS